ncbi:MAG: NrfD/PsrC family molybdoenzyme membrane anchor subunit, partial [Nitriliruptoraceae bacterium]
IFINPEDHSAEKCNFCAHRIDVGLEPACSVVCPVEAILVGDLNDPDSKVAQTVGRESVQVRRPEKDTKPKLFYRGAHSSTLDPLAAQRPTGDIFAWAQQVPEDGHQMNAGVPAGTTGSSSAAAILSYDTSHSIPWDWRVGLYTWTKSIAAGLFGVLAVLVLTGALAADSALWSIATPVVAGAMLATTAAVLIWDLEHPGRFLFILTRPQWRSWLVRGGVILAVYALVLAAHFVAGLLGATSTLRVIAALGIPAAVMAAVYTAFLFAQAKARDLWQNPLLVPHMAVQAALAGSAAAVLLAVVIEPEAVGLLTWVVVGSGITHLLLVLGELTLPHPTAHARMAAHNMVSGRLGSYFWASIGLTLLALLTPVAPVVGAVVGLAGLLAFEHAYVQAGQSVPLA